MRESVTTSTTHQYFRSWVQHRTMQLYFSVTFACGGNVEILVSTWCEAEVVHILKMILGKNYWCADSPGLHVYKSASLQVCKSASLQVCSLQVSHTVTRQRNSKINYTFSAILKSYQVTIWKFQEVTFVNRTVLVCDERKAILSLDNFISDLLSTISVGLYTRFGFIGFVIICML